MTKRVSLTEDPILETARQLFVEQGFVATTMTQIAGRAGVAESELRRRYPGKRDLLIAAVRQVILAMLTDLERRIGEAADEEVIDVVAAHLSSNPYLQLARLIHRDTKTGPVDG